MKLSADDQRWKAVLQRDPTAQFFYGVKTTAVYCRPSCASRLPLRKNVMFFTSCGAAESAGFRPCKRCQPHGRTLAEQYVAAVEKACRMIEAAEHPITLAAIAKEVGMSPFHFHRIFTKIAGLTPKAYGDAQRIERLRDALPQSTSVTQAIYSAGYNSNSRFYTKASARLGMRPKAFRKGGAGMTIRFTVARCSLGHILIAFSGKGICAILLGDEPAELARDLQKRFSMAALIDVGGAFKSAVSKVVAFVERPRLGLDLPLDIRGTAFQQRVWQALQQIPLGKTATYTEIARRLKLPKSVRAVAGAIAANPIAVAIPCHRVICSDGSLSGYRWGVRRKRALLTKETT